MTGRNSTMLDRWRNDIQAHDPGYKCLKEHKKSIGNTRQSSRLVVFWSFISLFYIYGDISIGIGDNQQDTNNEAVVWGISFIGITEVTFLSFVFVMTLYYFTKLGFSIIRVHIICNSLMAFKEIFSLSGLSDHDVAWQEIEWQETESQSKINNADTDHRETWLLMMKYSWMGFLEYFIAPIVFPMFLALWALVMLATEVFF